MESKFFIQSLGFKLISLVKIKDLPLLTGASVVSEDSNALSFNIFVSSSYTKDLIVSPVDELVLFILEHLEPSRVGAPDLHLVCSTSALDVPGLIVVSSSNSQSLLVEVPDLSLSTVWCLDDHVSVVDQVKISV
jgi:hypothetical protein